MDIHELKDAIFFVEHRTIPDHKVYKNFLRKVRRWAKSGKYGKYSDNKEEFEEEFKRGLADDLSWWRAKDGTYVDIWGTVSRNNVKKQ